MEQLNSNNIYILLSKQLVNTFYHLNGDLAT
nr:MAG TPA: hypothetical protein [Caudoviricetes sp.]DAX46530.1 MAG TPA: hypothetical protein [Caudoviricetes sp.]